MSGFMIERLMKIPKDKVWERVCTFHAPPCTDCAIDVIKEGDAARNDIGMERKITFSGGMTAHERIVDVNPECSFSYEMTRIPAKKYLGYAEFIEKDGNTLVHWSGDFKPLFPGAGFIVQRIAKKNINQILDDLEKK